MDANNKNKKTERLSSIPVTTEPSKPMSKKSLGPFLDNLATLKVVPLKEMILLMKNLIEPQFSFVPERAIRNGKNGEANTVYVCWCAKFETGHYIFYREETDLSVVTNQVIYNAYGFKITKDPEEIATVLHKFIESLPKHLRTVSHNPHAEIFALFLQRALTLNQNLFVQAPPVAYPSGVVKQENNPLSLNTLFFLVVKAFLRKYWPWLLGIAGLVTGLIYLIRYST